MAWVSLVVFAESQAFGKQKATYHPFDGCVFAADVGHGVAARAPFVFFGFAGFSRFAGFLGFAGFSGFGCLPAMLCRHGFPLWQKGRSIVFA